MRLIFLGTPSFAVPTLEAVVRTHDVVAVVTQPDRPKGRSQEFAAPPVKQAALRLGLPVYQPERIKRPEARAHLASLQPEIMVVVGYGQIIPQSVIDIAPRGIINVHASLLPKYRGAAPIQWAIVNGDTRTGVTTMQINAGLDTGDILLARSGATVGKAGRASFCVAADCAALAASRIAKAADAMSGQNRLSLSVMTFELSGPRKVPALVNKIISHADA